MRFSRLVLLTVALVVGADRLEHSRWPGAQSAKPKADDVGITDSEIRIAVIADVDTPVQPGLFQTSVDAMEAWAKDVNKTGGIAGRKVVIDFIDSKLNPNETRNAIIKACADDFAMVGSESLFLNNVDDMVACKDKAGEAIGIPDMPGTALDTPSRARRSRTRHRPGSYCETKDEHPQTYTVQQGDYLYYLKQNKDLHGIWTIPGDLKATKNAVIPTARPGSTSGSRRTARASTTSSRRPAERDDTDRAGHQAEQLDLREERRQQDGRPAAKEATLQGVDSVKVWACNQACYDNLIVEQGGADVDGTQILLTTLPFYSEYKSNPTLKKLVAASAASRTSTSTRVVVDRRTPVPGCGGEGDRQRRNPESPVAVRRAEAGDAIRRRRHHRAHRHRQPSAPCIVMTQIKDGKFVRTYPKKPGTSTATRRTWSRWSST